MQDVDFELQGCVSDRDRRLGRCGWLRHWGSRRGECAELVRRNRIQCCGWIIEGVGGTGMLVEVKGPRYAQVGHDRAAGDAAGATEAVAEGIALFVDWAGGLEYWFFRWMSAGRWVSCRGVKRRIMGRR